MPGGETTPPTATRRDRRRAAAALVLTIGAGFASRLEPLASRLPGALAEHTGDALYAMACFWLIGLARPSWPTRRTALLAWSIAAAVELSQLLPFDWLQQLRRGWARWILGQGFKAADLFAYAAGAGLAAVLDPLLHRTRPTDTPAHSSETRGEP